MPVPIARAIQKCVSLLKLAPAAIRFQLATTFDDQGKAEFGQNASFWKDRSMIQSVFPLYIRNTGSKVFPPGMG